MAEAVSDSFRLKWDDFQVNLVNHLKGSKGDTDFSDVTLVCEDGRQVEAHRMVLAAGSGFFNAVLREGFKRNVFFSGQNLFLNNYQYPQHIPTQTGKRMTTVPCEV